MPAAKNGEEVVNLSFSTRKTPTVRYRRLSRCYSARRDDSRSYDARPERSHNRTQCQG